MLELADKVPPEHLTKTSTVRYTLVNRLRVYIWKPTSSGVAFRRNAQHRMPIVQMLTLRLDAPARLDDFFPGDRDDYYNQVGTQPQHFFYIITSRAAALRPATLCWTGPRSSSPHATRSSPSCSVAASTPATNSHPPSGTSS